MSPEALHLGHQASYTFTQSKVGSIFTTNTAEYLLVSSPIIGGSSLLSVNAFQSILDSLQVHR